jgi:hypothetical protein
MRPRIDEQDIVGKKFGQLIIEYYLGRDNNHIYYHCRCDCGKEFDITRSRLIRQPCPATMCPSCRSADIKKKKAKYNHDFVSRPSFRRSYSERYIDDSEGDVED